MSRSRRKNPIVGYTTAKSEKPYKRSEHKRERRNIKQLLKIGRDISDHTKKKYGDPALGPKDGKQVYDNPDAYRK